MVGSKRMPPGSSSPAASEDGRQTQNGHSREHRGRAREQLASIQRARMLAAMAQVCAEHGAPNVTVAHVVGRAGVSRRTFYEMFDDIQDCLYAAFEEAVEAAMRRVLDAYDPRAKWLDRIRASLVALLSFLEAEPEVARLLIVDSLGAGRRALQRRQDVLSAAIAAVDEGRKEAKQGSAPPPLTAEGVVGGVLGVLHSRLSEQHPDPLIELAGPLMSMVIHPYRGAAAAKRELVRPLPNATPGPPAIGANPLGELRMRLTYRTIRVLAALASHPGSSNRQVADEAGIADQGQMSKLLARLQQFGLIENASAQVAGRGEPNAWMLTAKGWEMQGVLVKQSST